jgi:hypothetical protein
MNSVLDSTGLYPFRITMERAINPYKGLVCDQKQTTRRREHTKTFLWMSQETINWNKQGKLYQVCSISAEL